MEMFMPGAVAMVVDDVRFDKYLANFNAKAN